jgi:hypothetical protein
MGDEIVEVTERGYFSRIIESIKGVLFGLVLFLGSFALLFWNEGRAVQTAKSLDEGSASVVSVPAETVAAANEGKLVHLSGNVTTTESLIDDDFGVQVHALRLTRTVEMYQWEQKKEEETRKKLGGGEEKVTKFIYTKVWARRALKSSEFKEPSGHTNPSDMPYAAVDRVAQGATMGAFRVPPTVLEKLSKFEALAATEGQLAKLTGSVRARAKVRDSMLYVASDPSAPEVGDFRVSFQVVKPLMVSLVAKQVGNAFASYQAKAGDEILLVEPGAVAAATMFKSAEEANASLTWILRLVGWLLMSIGLTMMLKPIAVVADFIPAIGSFVGFGAFLFSIVLSSALSLMTIAIAWIAVRPLLGVGVLLAAAFALAATVFIGVKAKNARKPALLR